MRGKFHNLGTVLRHEYLGTIKQPVFWVTVFAFPLMMLAIGGVSYFSTTSTQAKIQEQSKQIQNTVVVDGAGVINTHIAETAQLALQPDAGAAIESVKQGSRAAAIIYPADLETSRTVQIYTNVTDSSTQSAYQKIAQDLLKQSILAPVGSEKRIQLVLQDVNATVMTYKNGQIQQGLADVIVPGAFLVLFYIVLIFSVNYMLTSVSEEKENRAMELILTTVRPHTLIVGKMLGIVLVTLTQIIVLTSLALALFLIAQQFIGELKLPFDLSQLVFNPERIAFGATFLIFGFLLFSGLMAGVGAIVPSAKEASGLSAIFIFGAIIPFYVFAILANSPDALVTKVFSFFPLTAPVTLLIRNTVGNIGTLEALSALVLLMICTALSFWLAARLFARGALEYNNRLSLKSIFK